MYDASVKKLRQEWFKKWCALNSFTTDTILNFHHTAGVGDKNIDVVMDRGLGGTVSITSVKKNKEAIYFNYEDVLRKKKSALIL